MNQRTRLMLQTLEDRRTPAIFTVTNTLDAGPGSLRAAIASANGNAGDDVIVFDASFATAKTIALTSEIAINDSVAIAGTGASLLTISGGGANRIFNSTSAVSSVQVTLDGLTLANGIANGSGGAIAAGDERWTLTNCVLTNNSATGNGGAIAFTENFSGRLTLDRTTLANNTAAIGGAIHVAKGATLSVTNSTLSGNKGTAVGGGGGIAFYGYFGTGSIIRNATIANNGGGGFGGGLLLAFVSGTLDIQNSTISGNSAVSNGGGIASYKNGGTTINVESTIVAGNSAPAPADIANGFNTFNVKNSAYTFANGITDKGGNLVSPFAFLGLGALADNGGPTQTFLPLPGRALIDAGSNPAGLSSDQRGQPRIAGTKTDIGSVESVVDLLVINTNDKGFGSLRQAILNANSSPGLDVITFDPGAFAGPQTISLSSGELVIGEAVTIVGPAVRVTVDAKQTSRVFNTEPAAPDSAISISNLTVTGGFVNNSNGGGIYVDNEALTLTNCTVTGNSASGMGYGGGIGFVGAGMLTLTSCTVAGNSSDNVGGGISLYNGGNLLLDSSTVSGNTASFAGGGVYIYGFNTAHSQVVRNSTISGNTALTGGGIILFGPAPQLTVQNSTIVRNAATGGFGGGIGLPVSSVGFIAIESSVVSGNGNATAPDISSLIDVRVKSSAIGNPANFTLIDLGGNLPFQPFANLKLGALANNGGPTQTIAPLAGSPLVNHGSNPALLSNDQRGAGYPRVAGAGVDIGAVEVLAPARVSNVVVGDGTNQRSRVTQLQVVFDSAVAFEFATASAFSLVRQSDSKAVALAAVLDPTNTIVTLTFAGGAVDGKSLADGRYTLTVDAFQFEAPGLDGNSDGIAGDNYVLIGNTTTNRLFRLFGDADGDGDVDVSDFVNFRAAFGTGPSIFDGDGDGDTDIADFVAFRSRFGTTVP